eukprot:3397508-Pleurochrysis_carterae.AAC.4
MRVVKSEPINLSFSSQFCFVLPGLLSGDGAQSHSLQHGAGSLTSQAMQNGDARAFTCLAVGSGP